MNILLRCESVSVKYDAGYALHDVSFELPEGEYLSIVGENGSGKTSLLKVIAGLIKPTEGQVLFQNGFEQSEIGYLPQQTIIQRDFPASVEEVVLSGRTAKTGFRPFFNEADKHAADEALNRLGISSLRKKTYRSLSGGQQQRVLLARALTTSGRLLLLDEPVTGLDPLVSAEFYEILSELHRQGMTIISVSHDVENAAYYGSLILQLKTDLLFFGKTGDWMEKGGFK